MPQPPILLPQQLSAVTVLHLTQPPASVLMVPNHNHNHSLSHSILQTPGVATATQQLIYSNGPGPDPTTGLCADGSQPQSQALNATAADLATQQLLCSNGTAPDPTTGLCADGSQPQPQSFDATDSWCCYCYPTTLQRRYWTRPNHWPLC